MKVKVMRCAAAAVLVVGAAGCRSRTPTPPPTPTPVPQMLELPSMKPEEVMHVKDLLFADTSLDEFVGRMTANNSQPEEEPALSLTQAFEDIRRGNTAGAKRKLRQVASAPDVETRVALLVWNKLRELGERPAAASAKQVQGVVCELHNEAGVGTLAVYRDGTARWLGGQGKVTFWDLPGADARIGSLIGELLKAAEAVTAQAPAAPKRMPGEPPLDHFRISVLTYEGIHAVERYGPGITAEHFAGPALLTTGHLIEALGDYEDRNPPVPAKPGEQH